MSRQAKHPGQAIVEFALTLSIFALVVLVVIQLGVLFVAYYSQTQMTRETARWLAVNRNATDDQVAAHVQATMLAGLVNGTPSGPTGVTCGSDVPGCTEYTVGNMVIQFTPCQPTGGFCLAQNRAPGNTLYVKMTYYVGPDANHPSLANTGLVFLASNFRIGSLSVGIPQSLPGYKISVMVE